MKDESKLPVALLSLRLGVFLVMLMWTVDKLLRADHAAKVFAHFYLLPEWGKTVFYVLGVLELLLLLGFLAGFKKRLTYGLVLFLHAVSTLSSFRQYLSPFEGPNLLFFAAWPMLSACFALYLLRDWDTLWCAPLPERQGRATSAAERGPAVSRPRCG